jgi:hypothetical protein
MSTYTEAADLFDDAAKRHRDALAMIRTGTRGGTRAVNAAEEDLNRVLPLLLTAATTEGYRHGTCTAAATLALIVPGPIKPRRVWKAWDTLSGRWYAFGYSGIRLQAFRGDLTTLPPFPSRKG